MVFGFGGFRLSRLLLFFLSVDDISILYRTRYINGNTVQISSPIYIKMYIVPDRQICYNFGIVGKVSLFYMKENYDEIKVRVEKGRRDKIKAHAEAHGESVNGFIGRAITETMERDDQQQAPSSEPDK